MNPKSSGKIYAPVYKCKICGKEFIDTSSMFTDNLIQDQNINKSLIEKYGKSVSLYGDINEAFRSIHMKNFLKTHSCGNGYEGIEELIGFKEIQI